MSASFGDNTQFDGRKAGAPPVQTIAVTDRLIAPIIRVIDAFLRRRQGIYEFDPDERCLFRISLHKFDTSHCWPDGTRLDAGTEIGELHFWQEHLTQPSPPHEFGSAAEFRRRMLYTLAALARWTETDPTASRLPGFFGDAWFGAQRHPALIERALVHWGFTVDQAETGYSFWDELYAELLARSLNPSKKGRRFRRMRIWMSRDQLLRRYATGRSSDSSSYPKGWRISSGMRGVD